MAGAPMQARKHSAKCGLTANPTTHATIHTTTTTWKNQLNSDPKIVTHYAEASPDHQLSTANSMHYIHTSATVQGLRLTR